MSAKAWRQPVEERYVDNVSGSKDERAQTYIYIDLKKYLTVHLRLEGRRVAFDNNDSSHILWGDLDETFDQLDHQ
jgi:hypothetical protein